MAENSQDSCLRCGTCCNEGGPALHRQDLPLVKGGGIALNRLVTIRKGELAHNPKTGRVQRVRHELVKINGTGRNWCCSYYDAVNKGCAIYAGRPQACEVLKCWDTEGILGLVEEDLLSRLDILGTGHPLVPVIGEHEESCPCPDLEGIIGCLPDLSAEARARVEALVNLDLQFRTRVVRKHRLPLAEELFFFGRPLFQLLQQLGVRISETSAGIVLNWPSSRENGS